MSLLNAANKNAKDKKKTPGAKTSKFGMSAAKGGGKSQTTGANNAANRSRAAGRGS